MEKFSIVEALRYVASGFILLIYFFLFDKALTETIVKTIGGVGIVGVSLAFGAVFYIVYRGCFYNLFIPKLQDIFRIKTDSYRTYLKKRHTGVSPSQIAKLYIAIRDTHMRESQKTSEALIANVHIGYMSALLAMPFTILSFVHNRTLIGFWFFIISFFIFLGTFLFERRFQSDECGRLSLISQEDIDKVVRALFQT